MTFPDLVQATVRRDFPESVWRDVFDALPPPGTFRAEVPVDRVLVAVVALASGNLDALRHFSARAIEDWRDVLYWHEHPRDPDEPSNLEEVRRRLGLPDDS